MKLALVGATGLVGRKMMDVLEERKITVHEFLPVASKKSVGTEVQFNGQNHKVRSIEEAVEQKPDVALFSAGGGISTEWAPVFAQKGTYVIDNSSAWRLDPAVPLVVPEINIDVLTGAQHIIANPNCSTIQMLVALAPLHRSYGIERIVVSTYQSITGTGKAAVEQMEHERKGESGPQVYPHKIDKNCLPHCDVFLENDYTKEEMKLMHETRKILDNNEIQVSATAVRVPVVGGHAESINVQLARSFTIDEVKELLATAPGLVLQDDPGNNLYPMPITAQHKDEVFVGRVRRDISHSQCVNLWVVADNLRKGAATNAVQILEALQARGYVS